jgi:hypothetical protein
MTTYHPPKRPGPSLDGRLGNGTKSRTFLRVSHSRFLHIEKFLDEMEALK